MPAPFQRLALCLLACLCFGTSAHACDFHVNSSADNDQVDGVLTLREALLIANGDHFNGNHIGTCRTAAELTQMSGANFVIVPPGPVCSFAETRYTILLPPDIGASCGDGIGDNISFDSNVGTVHASGGYYLGPHDTLNGMQPNGFPVSIVGPGAGSGSGILFGVGDAPSVWNNEISNLIISNFGLDGITAAGCQNASLTGLTLANNAAYGLWIDGNRCFTSKIGDTGTGQRNFIYANGSDGIHIDGSANGDPTAQNNLIRNNWIGLDGVSAFDASGNGGAGLVIFNSLGNTIGGGGANEGNVIAKNGGFGLWLRGPRARSNRVLGNLIGSSPDLDIASFPNYRGVQIDGGAGANSIGDAGTGEANVISGNANHGVYISDAGSDGNAVQYNIIGLNRARTSKVPNQQDGVSITNGAQQTGVHDNVISGNLHWGIYQAGATTFGTTINNNVIGLRGSANAANDNTVAANALGGILLDTTPNNTIGAGNRIAGNAGPGIEVLGEAGDANVIKGNVIGLNNAAAAAGNAGAGIYILNGADDTVIGGSSVADRNVIGANSDAGILVSGGATDGTVIERNYIGTDASGNVARGNGAEGIRIDAATHATLSRNLVAANGTDGIKFENGASSGYAVLNQVGAAATAALALPNGASGISLLSGSKNNSIGDSSSPFLFNVVVSHSPAGVFVSGAGTTNNVIVGNVLGSAGFANDYGVYVSSGATDTQITANAISENRLGGVAVVGAATMHNPIRDNQIFANGGLGIDLGLDGVSVNDAGGDGDIGPNNLQNYPTLYNVAVSASSVTFSALLASSSSSTFELAFFRSDRCDSSGFGEGQVALGKVLVNSDLSGNAIVTGVNYSVPNSQTQSSWLTATATSVDGDTSEFSACVGISDEIFRDGFGN